MRIRPINSPLSPQMTHHEKHNTSYRCLRNKRHILPLQQNPSQLPSLVLLRMYLNSIINHQIHKLIEALQLGNRSKRKRRDGDLL